ncbi:MAG: hypothetical protein JXR95_00460 [Deltaproteobacteria bacterium]|nr:hypothetical protein [Deltaproteobacteria bacterium]
MKKLLSTLALVGVVAFAACDDDSSNNTTNNNQNCGNGIVDDGEDCDGSVDIVCTDLDGWGFDGGTLTCNSDCTFNMTECTGGPECGDGVAEGDEECDETDLRDMDCTDEGFTSGTLSCNTDCTLNVESCSDEEDLCGNGVIDGDEVCDGAAHGTATCEDYGYSNGYLVCNTDCTGFNLGSCANVPGECGNGVVEWAEACDGEISDTCEDYGFDGGTLSCNDDCSVDFSACIGDYCELNDWYGDEYCDACELMGGVHDPDCDSVCSESDGTCGSYQDQLVGSTTCLGLVGTEDPDCGECGNGTWDQFGTYGNQVEDCDGTDVGGYSCTDFGDSFAGGTLACSDNCKYDLSGCIPPVCGNGILEAGETCDGTDFGGATCSTSGEFDDGDLSCSNDCTEIVTTACVAATCGNDLVGGSEDCDNDNLNGSTCSDVGNYDSGTLACDACSFDDSGCVEAVCGNGLLGGDEVCDGSELGEPGFACTDLGYTGGDLSCLDCSGWSASECTGFECNVAADLGTFSGTEIVETGDICDGDGTMVFNGYVGTDYGADGTEKVFTLTLEAGASVNIEYAGADDNVIMVVTDCGDLMGYGAVSVDADYETFVETLTLTNETEASVTYYVVADFYEYDCADGAGSGEFTLTVSAPSK